jgi:serine/threonine protein kinase
MPTMEGMKPPQAGGQDSGMAVPESKWKGRQIKRFKLLNEIGEGAMGRVFLAEDTVLSRHVALKLLPARRRDGSRHERTDRLIREARSAARLEHPNVVTVYEIDELGGAYYIAMELVEGGNLERLVQLSGPMEIERACQLAAEAAEALAHAHERGVIHRDVKPANLLLTRSGRCKVADFGLAMVDDLKDASQRGRCVGTPNFVAPELALGHQATAASDIYSLGITLWYLLTGRPPFSASSSRELLKLHVREPLPDIRRWRADVPERLVQAIERACAKQPSERFTDAERFAKLLRTFTIPTGTSNHSGSAPVLPSASMGGTAAASSAQMPMISGSSSQTTQIRSQSPILWAGIGTVVAVVLIAIGVWLAQPGRFAEETAAAPPAPLPTVVVPPADTPAQPPKNVVLNGSMDATNIHGGVAGWFIHERFGDAAQVVEEDGNRFLRLTNDDPAKTVFADQRIEVDPSWRAVLVSARMRASDFTPGEAAAHDARVAFAFRDAEDNRVGNWPPVPSLRQNSSWVERVVTVDVPPGATSIYIQLAMLYATGTVDFDDIRIIPQYAE